MDSEHRYLFDRPKNVSRILYLLYACCLAVLAMEAFVHRHVEHPWEGVPGFYPLYGFVGCVILVLVAKWMRRIVMRPENYYQRQDLPQHPPASKDAS